MSFRRYDQVRPFALLGLIVLAWIVLPVFVKTFGHVSFFELQAPVLATASHVRDLQDYWSERLHSKSELIAAGRELRQVYAGYELQVQQAETLRAEIASLEQLLRLPSNPAYRYEHARVAKRDLSGWWQQLVIRKGANFGLKVGAPVVYAGGVVGRVHEVHAYTATVDLVTSPRVRLAAHIEGDPRPISYQGGDNPPLAPAHGTVEFVPFDLYTTSAEPRRLITSSLGGVFPAGLTIGRVVKLEASTDGLFKSGEVALDPRLAELTEVTVLVPLRSD